MRGLTGYLIVALQANAGVSRQIPPLPIPNRESDAGYLADLKILGAAFYRTLRYPRADDQIRALVSRYCGNKGGG